MINNRRLRIHHLNLLINLAETGSLSETAKVMHSTQPGLSKWLKELEEDIGESLFERHARGLEPNAFGKIMLQHAHRVINELARAQYNLEALSQGDNRTVKIGSSPAAAPTFVPAAVSKYLQQYPNAKIAVREGTMNGLLADLESGKLDVVVGRLDNYSPSEQLISEVLYKESLCIVGRPEHPLASRQNITWEQVIQYDWIVWPVGTPIRSLLDYSITTMGKVAPKYRVESSSQIANLWLLQFSDMLSVSSQRVAHHFVERELFSIIDVPLPQNNGGVGMVWRVDEPMTEASEDLMRCLRTTSAEIEIIPDFTS